MSHPVLPPQFSIPVYGLGDRRRGKGDLKFLQVTVDEHHRVIIVNPHNMLALSDESVDLLREALKETRAFAQRRRPR